MVEVIEFFFSYKACVGKAIYFIVFLLCLTANVLFFGCVDVYTYKECLCKNKCMCWECAR